jgi:PAS domain S-box-containing protein
MSQTLRLLIVEDSEDDAELLLRELRRGGYTVIAERVDTPAAMRAALERQTWDIVTSDHAMPKFSAPAALALLKELQPELPFVIISNEIDLNLAVSLMKAGAQDYIQKRELAKLTPAVQRELRDLEVRRQQHAVEAALRDSERRYRDLVELLPQVIFETDLPGNLLIVNRLAYDLFGYSVADFEQGLNLFQMIVPEEHARARTNIHRLLQGEPVPPALYQARRKDGHVFPVEITAVICWQDQQPVGMRGVLKDMTERQDLIRELGEAHHLLAATFEQTPVPFMLVRAADRTIQIVNAACLEVLGIADEPSLIGQSLFESNATWQEYDTAGQRLRVPEMPLARALRGIATRNEECRLRRKDGLVHWLLVTAAPIYNQAGEIIAAFSIFPEITDRKQAEELIQAQNQQLVAQNEELHAQEAALEQSSRDLRDSVQRYQTLAEAAQDMIFIVGRDDRIEYANSHAASYFSCRPEDLIGQVRTRYIPDPPYAGQLSGLEAVYVTGQPTFRENCYHIGNRAIWLDTWLVPLRDAAGEITSVMGYARDITARKLVEAELEASRARLKAIFDNAGVGMAVTDNTGRYIQVNDQWATLLNYQPGHLLQKSPVEVTHISDQAESQMLRESLRLGTISHFNLEQRFVRSDGRSFWGYLSATPLRAPDGTLDAIIDVITDITARKQMEVSLQEERDLFMAGPIILIRWLQGPTWPVTYVSPNVFTHFGYTPEDLTSGRLAYAALIHPQDRPKALANDDRFVAGDEDCYEQDYRLARADGQYRWVHDFTRAIRGPNGERLKFHGYLRDITDSKQAAAELEQRQQELAAVGQLVSAIATNLNLAEILDQALCGALALTGLEGGAVCLVQPGRQGLVLVAAQNAPPDLLTDLSAGEVNVGDCLCSQVAQTGTPQITWDGAPSQAEALPAGLHAQGLRFHGAFPLKVKDQSIGVLCLFARSEVQPTQRSLDLVQQLCGPIALAIDNARLYEQSQSHAADLEQRVVERTVQLAAINQELEAFSYSVAHDLRVPLRSIDGYSQVLLEDCGDELEPDNRRHLERIRAATQRMHQLINDLLELSRLTRGDLERVPLDLSALAQAIAAELQQRSPTRPVEFVIAAGILVRADAHLMHAALENLLDNAWKFTGKVAGARIEFGEQRRQRDGQEERVYFVRDNGAGFDMAQADKLFQTFQRLHGQDEFPGTGIGLATVKRIIHRHGGRLWAEGAEGQGATFYFTL